MLFTLNSNEPIRVAHIQKFANQSMLNGALLTAKVKNVLIKKRYGQWKIYFHYILLNI